MSWHDSVLVIDDDPAITGLLIEQLALLGYQATSAPDAFQALIQAEALRPKLIITDIMMPFWGSGIDVYKRFHEHDVLKQVPLIFITAMDPLSTRKLIPSDPRVRVVYKPLSIPMLEQAVRDLIGAPSNSPTQAGPPA